MKAELNQKTLENYHLQQKFKEFTIEQEKLMEQTLARLNEDIE